MSCKDCDDLQDRVDYDGPSYFIRIGNGNVQLLGCEKHVRLFIQQYNATVRLAEAFNDMMTIIDSVEKDVEIPKVEEQS